MPTTEQTQLFKDAKEVIKSWNVLKEPTKGTLWKNAIMEVLKKACNDSNSLTPSDWKSLKDNCEILASIRDRVIADRAKKQPNWSSEDELIEEPSIKLIEEKKDSTPKKPQRLISKILSQKKTKNSMRVNIRPSKTDIYLEKKGLSQRISLYDNESSDDDEPNEDDHAFINDDQSVSEFEPSSAEEESDTDMVAELNEKIAKLKKRLKKSEFKRKKQKKEQRMYIEHLKDQHAIDLEEYKTKITANKEQIETLQLSVRSWRMKCEAALVKALPKEELQEPEDYDWVPSCSQVTDIAECLEVSQVEASKIVQRASNGYKNPYYKPPPPTPGLFLGNIFDIEDISDSDLSN